MNGKYIADRKGYGGPARGVRKILILLPNGSRLTQNGAV